MSFKRITAATLISMAILSGCATTATTTAVNEPESQVKIGQADERILGYFSADGEFGQEKSINGYMRKYLGKTAEGKSVLQDFYAINGKPQTSPFVLFDDAGLEDWNSLQYTEGDIVLQRRWHTVCPRHLNSRPIRGQQHPIPRQWQSLPQRAIQSKQRNHVHRLLR